VTSTVPSTLEDLLRELAPQVLGAILRRYRTFAIAEDAVQEALLAAAVQWPQEGIPENPRGWLIQVASRRLKDHLRSDASRRRREELAQPEERHAPAADLAARADRDDTLALLFTCCHPALTSSSAIALTLRAVGGLTTAEIARAFLVPEATMAQRISRAKQSIKSSGIRFRMPSRREWNSRLGSVLHVLYLIFNEGYASSEGADLQRDDLAREAIRLTRAVHRLLPKDPEVAGLLCLMLLTEARRLARTGPAGELIPLDQQDRRRWDEGLIAEGTALLTATLAQGAIGAYQLQAAIAAIHDEAKNVEDTDWPQILAFYGLLRRISPSPMVELSHAVALAMVQGPAAGLAAAAELAASDQLGAHYRLDAVRAHLHEMAGDAETAQAHYRAAAQKTASLPERTYLLSQAARLHREGE
jgi:RNA polymerase sigma factor (sigma-70 family)